MLQSFRKIIRKAGYDIVSFPYFVDKQRIALFRKFDIHTIVDIGANQGQYANAMWALGFDGTIISFEPVKATYDKLCLNQTKKGNWIKKHLAVGAKDEESTIHVTENTLSSSLLAPLDGFLESTPEAKVLYDEKIKVVKLDSVAQEILSHQPQFFLKIDAQGFEKNILDGAAQSLQHYTGIQIELSLKSLYEGEQNFFELFPYLLNLGFKLHVIENGYKHPISGEVLQVELIMFREK